MTMHKAAHAKLEGFKDLTHNWDSYGGRPTKPEIITAAHELLDRLSPDIPECLHVAPCSSGNVQFVWETESRSLDLEIETPETISYGTYCSQRDKQFEENRYPLADFARSIELIRWVLAGT